MSGGSEMPIDFTGGLSDDREYVVAEAWRARRRAAPPGTSVDAQIAGAQPGSGTGEVVPIELEYDIRSAAPPWESGSLLETAGRVLATQEEGDLMGGPRFEQLFRATGTLRVG